MIGSWLGSYWTIKPLEVLFLSTASGSILYIVGELLHLGRKLNDEVVTASGLLAGFFLAFVTDLLILVASAILESLGFRQLLTVWRAGAFLDVFRQSKAWGRMERKGFTPGPHVA